MNQLMGPWLLIFTIGWIDYGTPLPLNTAFMRTLALKRQKRGTPTGNAYDPPKPDFPSQESKKFWLPDPYPFPVQAAPPPSIRHKLPYYDPNNPYLDAMTDGYWPNYGLGITYQNPTQVAGRINFPTGDVLEPSAHVNGSLGYSTPTQIRLGMQGGPLFPWQSPSFVKTAKDINDANTLQQLALMQGDIGKLNGMPAAATQTGVPTGFIPVQPQQQQTQQYVQMQPQYVQQPPYQYVQMQPAQVELQPARAVELRGAQAPQFVQRQVVPQQQFLAQQPVYSNYPG